MYNIIIIFAVWYAQFHVTLCLLHLTRCFAVRTMYSVYQTSEINNSHKKQTRIIQKITVISIKFEKCKQQRRPLIHVNVIPLFNTSEVSVKNEYLYKNLNDDFINVMHIPPKKDVL